MPASNIDNLNNMQLDVLREIGNIGSGNAATSLSQMIGSSVDIAVPTINALDYNEVVNLLGGPENLVVGLLIRVTGDITGMMMYILQNSFANKITNTFFQKSLENVTQIDEMDQSAICEIGNIMAASYINAISALTGLSIDISPPLFCADMVGAIMSVPAIEFAEVSDKVLFIDDSFMVTNDEIKSNMILIPETNSLSLLFTKLGVEV